MARVLNIIAGIVPNYKGNTHYLYPYTVTGLSHYASELVRQAQLKGGAYVGGVSMQDYRITNQNTVIISLSKFERIDPHKATYIIEQDTAVTPLYVKCYFVRSVEVFSDKVFLTLDLDIWGTYAPVADITKVHVRRSNRHIGHGYYDNVQLTKIKEATDFKYFALDGGTTGTVGVNTYTESQVTAVFIASVVISQTNDGTEKVTQTIAFGVTLSKIRTAMQTASGATFTAYNGVELAQAFIAGIASINTTGWATNKVNVLRMYLVPSIFVNLKTTGFEFNARTRYTGSTTVTLTCAYVANSVAKNTFALDFSTFDLNYKYFVGTYAGGLELNLATDEESIYYNVVVTPTDLRIEIGQGSRVMEITKYFECSVNGSATIADSMDKTKWWIEYISLIITKSLSLGMAIETKNYAGAVGAGTGVLGYIANANMQKVDADGFNGNGDATTSYTWALTPSMRSLSLLICPLYITAYRSVENEELKASRFGASYDVYMSLNDIATYNLLVDGAETRTYVEATADVDGVPLDAIDAIKDRLNSGIYYEIIN